MKAERRSKKASGTGEMTAETFFSLFNHLECLNVYLKWFGAV